MEHSVSFAFSLDQKVKTPFGDVGIVSTCGFDDSGEVYYVKTATGGNWFKESQLEAVPL